MSGARAYCVRAGAELACLLDERLEERSVLPGLGMPLHAHGEPERRILDRLERPVLGPRGLDQPVAEPSEALVVVRRHVGARSHDRAEPRAVLDLDRMHGELARHLLVDVVPDGLGKVLHEVAAAGDVQELEAAADRERRHVALERRLQERQLTRVTTGLRRVGLRVGIGPVARGIDVGAAREHDPVERVERLLDVLLGRRDDERTTSCALDRVDVGERDERGGQVPHAPARVLRVRRDPDDRPHAASVSTIQSVPSAHVIARPVGRLAAHAKDAHGLAVELGEGATVAGDCGVEAPRANLARDLVRGSRPVDPGVLGLEEAEVAGLALVLRIAGVAALDPLEDTGQEVADRGRELRRELVPPVLVAERDPLLGEDVPGVELGVHVVEGEADLVLAVADRPRRRGSARGSGEAATDAR